MSKREMSKIWRRMQGYRANPYTVIGQIIGEFLALLLLFVMIIGWAALYYGAFG